ncbi:tetratricopeptide repeat protein [Aneurinibacillus uraniidurans]|uniref:tetratricopeptide repeat protein n=1 Tax=Aneurinibacillus uraniidurans TaxID=2966586 RepID=UPI00234B5872|nr:tetratricopeptide repeat protein [Aneurinibacillus sp. B1]WCN36307.1 tetratricopeptide repeat protein [Aneurinibacillus sp. B1]
MKNIFKKIRHLHKARYLVLARKYREAGEANKSLSYYHKFGVTELKDDDLIHVAEMLHITGKTEKAIQLVSQIIERAQSDAAYERRAHYFFENNESDKALLDLDEAIRINPHSPIYWYTRALAYSNLGNYQKAIEDMEECIKRESPEESISTHYAKGIIHMDIGEYSEAAKAFMITVKDMKYAVPIYFYRLSEALKRQENLGEAIHYLSKGKELLASFESKLDHGIKLYCERGNFSRQASNSFRETCQNQYNFTLPLAKLYYAYGKYDKALEQLNEGLLDFPQSMELLVRKIVTLQKMKQRTKAQEVINHALHIDANSSYPFHEFSSMAAQLHDEGETEYAIQLLTNVIERADYDYAYERRAHILRESDEDERALADLNEAIRLNPEPNLYWYTRSLVHSYFGDKQKAVEDMNESIKRRSREDAFSAYYEKGSIYMDMGAYSEAVLALKTSVEDPNYAFPVYYYRLSESLQQLGEIEEAIYYLLKGKELLTFFESRHDQGLSLYYKRANYSVHASKRMRQIAQEAYLFTLPLAILYYENSDYTQALLQLEEGLEHFPTSVELLIYKTMVLREMNKQAEAKEVIKQALHIDEQSPYPFREFSIIAARLHSEGKVDQSLQILTDIIEYTDYDYAYERRAHILRESGEDERALADLNEAIRLNPKPYMYWYARAIIYKDFGDFEQAVADFNEVIKRETEETVISTYYELARTYVQMEDYPEAIRIFKMTVEDPSREIPIYYYWLSYSLEQIGEVEEAIHYLQKGKESISFFESQPDHGISLYQERAGYSMPAIDAVRSSLQTHCYYTLPLARLYLTQENYTQAQEQLDEGLSIFPQSLSLLFCKSEILQNMGRWKEAETLLLQAVHDHEEEAPCYELARLYWAQDEDEQALQVLLTLHEKHPPSPTSLYLLADAYYRLERYEEAYEINKKLIEMEDDDVLNFVQQGNILVGIEDFAQANAAYSLAIKLHDREDIRMKRSYARYQIQQHENALEDLYQAAELNPELKEVEYYHTAMGRVFYGMELWELALTEFTEGLRINPEAAWIYEQCANCHIQLDKPKLAIRDCTRGLAIDPLSGSLYWLRGYLHYQSGNYEEALLDTLEYRTLHPELDHAHYNLGVLYRRLRRIDEALEVFTQCLTINPQHGSSYLERAHIYYDHQLEFALAIDDIVLWSLYEDKEWSLDERIEQISELDGFDDEIILKAINQLQQLYNPSPHLLQ